METQATHNSVINQDIKTYSVVDEQDNLIGQVEKILRNRSGETQIIFSLTGYSKPLFKVHQRSLVRVDLSQNKFIVKLTEKMRDRLNQYLSSLSSTEIERDQIEAVDDEEDENSATSQHESYDEVTDEQTVRLLAERLDIKRDRKKVGEVIIRKQVETEIVEVPVRREKLIVEQVGSTNKQLAEIELSSEKVEGIEGIEGNTVQSQSSQPTVSGEFISVKAANKLLEIIAMNEHHGCAKVKIELVLDDPQYQQQYQNLFKRCMNS